MSGKVDSHLLVALDGESHILQINGEELEDVSLPGVLSLFL